MIPMKRQGGDTQCRFVKPNLVELWVLLFQILIFSNYLCVLKIHSKINIIILGVNEPIDNLWVIQQKLKLSRKSHFTSKAIQKFLFNCFQVFSKKFGCY